jgi:cytochrome oxidase Cu insertion factor (SCO1/SenC/PrrC family)
MICNNTKDKVKELIKQGLKENIDFRVVYFSNKTEVQMVRK